MNVEIWAPWKRILFLDPTWLELGLLVLYGAAAVALLVLSRRDWLTLIRSRRRGLLFVVLAALPLVTSHLLPVRFSSVSLPPLPRMPVNPTVPFAALTACWPVVAAGIWLGAGPALLVGAVAGLVRAGTMTGGVTDPLQLALFGFLVAWLMRQDYQGRLERVVRQPIVASLLAAVVTVVLIFLSAWARVANAGLAGFDYALQFARLRLGCALLEAISAGLLAQVMFLVLPSSRPVRAGERVSPLSRRLNRKILVVVVPLVLLMTVGLLYAVTTITLRGAKVEAEKDLGRAARSAADAIPDFIYTGQGLLAEFAADERLSSGDQGDIERLLESDLRIGAFFDHLMLFGPDGDLIAMYPSPPAGDAQLTTQEEALLARVLRDGAPQISSGHRSQHDEALLSFMMPTDAVGVGESPGCLIGRTHLQGNPTMERILANLQWTTGRGEGFIVDSQARILAHPDPGTVLSVWEKGQYAECIVDAGPQGQLCEGRHPVRNTRELLYYFPADGYPWAVVIRLPYEIVLNQAREVAVPLLALQSVFCAVLVVAIGLLVGRVTDPLKKLADAAERIATGTLTEPISIGGPDEVGRLGLTLEDMRRRLKNRMSDLSLLLEVSQAVSSTLDLSTAFSFVLEGALTATGADVARAVILGDDDVSRGVISRGEAIEGLEELEDALFATVDERRRPVVVSGAEEVERLLGADGGRPPIQVAVALPVCTKDHLLAVIWIGYLTAPQFEGSKLDFLSMLANQVAVLVENARLFEAVEGERTRLAAILESVSDVVLVTDRDQRLLLVNSAAERALGIRGEDVLGQRIDQAGLVPEVMDAVLDASSTEGAPQELFLPEGRVLYADVSNIENVQGEHMGRVAVMRDITRFKELDQMKSEFLATVSHDLRAPLTFMRGYAEQLDAVGELNEKQRAYVKNILRGVQRIDHLVLDLLDLSRIEAGLGMDRRPCNLGVLMAEAVSSLRGRATEKNISLQIHPALESSNGGGEAVVSGDRALLRQAFINLLDNAIKYTPNGGQVSAGFSVEATNGHNRATVRVADTGIGIAPDEQVRLFEKFYRTKRGTKSAASGTGLGLAIVKSIVERHDGKVWVESKPDEGSAFYVTLPLHNGDSDGMEQAR